ncbi:MAG: SUMF1/EgtB/PvdO family nonheme iron enzyme [Flavobacteriia bacterium]
MNKEKHLEDLFRAANSQPPVHSFDETKNRLLNTLENASSSSDKPEKTYFTLKNIIIMITSLSSIIIAVVLWNTNENTEKARKETIVQSGNSEKNPHVPDLQQVDVHGIPKVISVPTYKKQVSVETKQVYYIPVLTEDSASAGYRIKPSPLIPTVKDDDYIFPKLTEKEIAANHKKKKQMLRALEKLDKKGYIRMPSGSFEFDGKTVSVQSFMIQRTEVTNLEYRTFLFDLLIQGRKDEFLKAKPDQSQWSKVNGLTDFALDPMEENYFSHPAYNDYPVVNVSREGAEMYCKWLTQELIKVLDTDDAGNYNDVRIPGRVEWVYAASTSGTDYPYPWKGQFLRNSEGCFLANYKPFENSYFDDGGFFTVKVDSYNPNSAGIYNMSGNVAEMVYNAPNSRKDPGTAGGGWMNNAEEIKILGPDPYSGKTDAHPNIGFRVVMTVKKM